MTGHTQPDLLTRQAFGDLVAIAGYPVVRLGACRLDTVASWQRVLPQLCPIEMGWILHQLRRSLLVVTSEGRRKLRVWLDATHGHPIPVEARADRVRRIAETLAYHGDLDVLAALARTLADLPRPVIDHVLTRVAIILAGRSTSGWTCGALPAGRHLIVLAGHRDDAAIAWTFRHEVAHSWLHVRPADVAAPCLLTERAVLAALEREQLPASAALAIWRRHELEAEAFVIAWAPQ